MKWNPRFVAYAAAHGKTPSAMLEHDDEAWPGGKMCGFILWIREKIFAFVKEHPKVACCRDCAGHKPQFTKFLQSFTKLK